LVRLECSWQEAFENIRLEIKDPNKWKMFCSVYIMHSPSSFHLIKNKVENEAKKYTLGDFAEDSPSLVKLMETLPLSSRRIESLALDCFQGLRNLKYLSLADNNLQSLRNDQFVDLKSLLYLNLERCQLEELDEFCFNGLDSLEDLLIGGNNLKNLRPKRFAPLVSLSKLHIDQCNIESIEENAFQGLTNLVELEMGGNLLKSLHHQLFEDDNRMELLLLNNNKIEYIGPSSVNNLQQLKQLNLSHNNVEILEADLFHRLSSLRDLSAHDCGITFIEEQCFVSWTHSKLKVLELQSNKFQDLEHTSILASKTMNWIKNFALKSEDIKRLYY
jgi:Leucine-rich repeat (LRR) protein